MSRLYRTGYRNKLVFLICLIFGATRMLAQKPLYNEKVFLQWKESLIQSTQEYRENKNTMGSFMSLLNHIDSSVFDTLFSKLSQESLGEKYNYYIIINDKSGEYSTTDIILRAYTKSKGVEIYYRFAPKDDERVFIRKYKHNKRLFSYIFNDMKYPRVGGHNMLSISLKKNDQFFSKLLCIDITNYIYVKDFIDNIR